MAWLNGVEYAGPGFTPIWPRAVTTPRRRTWEHQQGVTTMDKITEPTGEQCNANALVYLDDDDAGYAMWYPQMGGYSSKAVAVFGRMPMEATDSDDGDGCFDVWVWHDGEFPFGGANPRRIHHCMPSQFIQFGETVMALAKSAPKQPTRRDDDDA